MTKKERIDVEQKKKKSLERKLNIKNKIKLGIKISFPIVVILAIVVGIKKTPEANMKNLELYVQGVNNNASEILSVDGGFSAWQEKEMHNDINCLLGGGYFYRDPYVTVQPNKNMTESIVKYKDKKSDLKHAMCSYVNVKDNNLYYRDSKTKRIISRELNTSKSQVIFKGKSGEIILYNDNLYFIDLDNNSLKCLNVSDTSIERTIIDEVEKFFVYDSTCVCLLNNNTVVSIDILEDSQPNLIASNIDEIFFNGKVVAQTGNTIIEFSVDGKGSHLLVDGNDATLKLVGASENNVYFTQNNHLKYVSGENIQECSDEIIQGLYSLVEYENEIDAIAFGIDNQAAYEKVLTFNR